MLLHYVVDWNESLYRLGIGLDDEIKRKLHKANQDWNGWKFQIHWNKL